MVGVPAPAAVSTANAHLPVTPVFAACARTGIELTATIAATAIAFSQPDVVSISAPHVDHESHETFRVFRGYVTASPAPTGFDPRSSSTSRPAPARRAP